MCGGEKERRRGVSAAGRREGKEGAGRDRCKAFFFFIAAGGCYQLGRGTRALAAPCSPLAAQGRRGVGGPLRAVPLHFTGGVGRAKKMRAARRRGSVPALARAPACRGPACGHPPRPPTPAYTRPGLHVRGWASEGCVGGQAAGKPPRRRPPKKTKRGKSRRLFSRRSSVESFPSRCRAPSKGSARGAHTLPPPRQACASSAQAQRGACGGRPAAERPPARRLRSSSPPLRTLRSAT